MLSLHQLSVAGAAFLLAALFHARNAQGASVRQHRLRGGSADDLAASAIFTPSYDMVKALEYIESLRHQTGREEEPARDYDEADGFPYASRLAQLQSPERAEGTEWQDHKTQQWLRALLRNLQRQAGTEPKEAPAVPGSRYAPKNRQYVAEEDAPPVADIGDYGANPKPHKKYPLMFEDEASEEGPSKRANEHAEEQYTPQSLATLQSVFEELGKLSASKNQKRENLDEEQKLYRGDDDDDEDEDDMYRVRSLAYEDVTGGEDWTPVEENVETEEEVRDSQEMFDRDLDEDDVKRSTSPTYGGKEDQDDINRLVDYYLLKILEKTERAEERRDRDEERRARKRLARPSYGVDPLAFYQLMEISRKLQVPPEDLIEMVRNGEARKQEPAPDAEEEPEEAEDPGQGFYASKLHQRRLPDRPADGIPDDLDTKDILNILGLESSDDRNAKYPPRQSQPKRARHPVTGGRRENYSPPKPSDKRTGDYDGGVDEDELATFLAAKMLAQYPDAMNKADQRRHPQLGPREALAYGIPEQAVKDYIDRMDGEKSGTVKRQAGAEAAEDSTQTQRSDHAPPPVATAAREPGAEEGTGEKDLTAKTPGGM